LSILGNRVARTEDERLIKGAGKYVSNLKLPGCYHLAFALSPIPHGRIREIHTEEAKAIDGVVAIYTGADIPMEPIAPAVADRPDTARPFLASDKVRYVGEPYAMVVARTAEEAYDAASSIWADFEELDPVIDPLEAVTDARRLFEGSNVVSSKDDPEPEDLFADSDVVVRARFVNQRLAPVPLEVRSTAAWIEDERLVVATSTQSTHRVKDLLVKHLGIDANMVRVIAFDIGGGFGAKATVYPEELLCAFVAWTLRHPVKWVEPRSASMLGLVHGRGQIQEVELGARSDGKLAALKISIIQDTGAYPYFGALLPNLTIRMSSGNYAIEKIHGTYRSVVTNTTPIAAYRGAGRPEATALIERAIDMVAAELGMDPADIRRKNLVPKDHFPFRTATGVVYDSGNYQGALEKLLDEGKYESLRAEQERRRARGAKRLLGIGLSCYVEITNGFNSSEYARVSIEEDGTAKVYTGTAPHGQGHETAWAMIASEVLGIDFSSVRVVANDTDQIPRGVGTFGSRSAQTGGVSVAKASEELLGLAKEIASDVLEADPADIVGTKEGLQVKGSPQSTISWSEIHAAASERGIELVKTFDFEPSGPTFPFGAHMAVIELDVETGKVEIIAYYAVDDAGNLVNPLLAEGQLHGGIAQGIAQALYEEFRYDENGNPMTATLADYEAITAAELPSFNLSSQVTPTPVNPLGVKGIGESGTTGATPAVWNAVVDAVSHLGIRNLELPLGPEQLWREIASHS
jgi:carbon-monoxide dehydrogenase large subunit